MRNYIFAFLLIVFGIMYYNDHQSRKRYVFPFSTSIDTIGPNKRIKTAPKITKRSIGGLMPFLKKLGRVEGRSYGVVSERGYLGMYQFHPNTLRSLGINVTAEEFLNRPSLQDSAAIALLKQNKRILNKVIKRFDNSWHDGMHITKSGILAAAHLVGPGGVLSYFYPDKYTFNTVDGNGVHITQYMEKFAGYDLRELQ